MRQILAAFLLLTACSRERAVPADAKPTPAASLEAAAIEAGVISDPASVDLVGLYARDTDRVCIVPDATAYRIGVFVDYGENQTCSATGVVTRVGETLSVDFPGTPGCNFDARFEGDRIVFPGQLPDGCARHCERRASMAALDVDRLSESASEASTLRDARGRQLCAGN